MSLRKVTCPETRKPFHQMGAQNEQTQNKMCIIYIIYVLIYYLFIYLYSALKFIVEPADLNFIWNIQ